MTGRLAVATESAFDLSKPIKSCMVHLLGLQDDVIGSDVMSACYGGTQVSVWRIRVAYLIGIQAFYNAINWIESREWNGRYALVLCGDTLMVFHPINHSFFDSSKSTAEALHVQLEAGEPLPSYLAATLQYILNPKYRVTVPAIYMISTVRYLLHSHMSMGSFQSILI